MEHDLIQIPPFSKLGVISKGSIAYTVGNVPYIGYSEGKHTLRLPMGAVFPVDAAHVELWNPFSVAAKVQIARGMREITPSNAVNFLSTEPELIAARGGVQMAVAASGAYRRGVLVRFKRGVNHININLTGGTADDYRAVIVGGYRADDMDPMKPPTIAALADVPMYRNDARPPVLPVVKGGAYLDSEMTAWLASISGAGARYIQAYNGGPPIGSATAGWTLTVDDDALFILSTSNTATARFEVATRELGDMKNMTVAL